jgi:hypothetical protein
MKGRSALVTMFAGLLLAPTMAWAQDEEESTEENAEEATEEAAEDAEEAAEETGEAVEEATEEVDAAAGGRWPRAVIARPLTLPKGITQVGAAITSASEFEVFNLGLNAGYAISDDLEIRAFYGLTLKEFEAKGPLDIEVGYKILRGAAGGKLEVIARADTGYNFLDEGLLPLNLGAQVQYNVSDKLAIITPGRHLNIALEEIGEGDAAIRPITFTLPVGVGYQATPELYVQADTTLFVLEISDAASTFIFDDTTPLAVTATYNVQPALDVFAGISTDLSNDPDKINILVGANYYLGSL